MFDAITLQAVAAELNSTILHGRIQDVVQLDAQTFGFEIYAQHIRRYLYITVHPDDARVHFVSQKLRGSGEAPSPLLALLRKYGEGAFIDAVAQLPHERVLKLQLDHSSEGVSTLVVETIGKYSNIILLDAAGIVIDALKRVSAHVNRARVILPKHHYVPPPPQAKLDPAALTPETFVRLMHENTGALIWQTLVKTIAGVSPLLAREIAFRATQRADTICDIRYAERLWQMFALVTHAPWQPSIASEDDEPAAFAPYLLTHLGSIRPFDSISTAIETFYGTPESYAAVKEPLRTQLAAERDRLARKRDALAQEQARAHDIERLRISGEMILAYAYQITPGEEVLNAETENGTLQIPLNPNWSVVENAQKYFKDYHRAKDAAARVPALLAAANAEVEYAEQMLNDLELAENRAEIDAVVQAAREAGLLTLKQKRAKVTLGEPRTFTSRDGLTILVGKNAQQNEQITFRRAKPDDLWLHARNVAGAHVIIIRAGDDIPQTTVEQAAELAARYSQARNDSAVDVIVTPRRNVHRVRGGKAGMVTVANEKIIRTKSSRNE